MDSGVSFGDEILVLRDGTEPNVSEKEDGTKLMYYSRVDGDKSEICVSEQSEVNGEFVVRNLGIAITV